MNQPTCLDGPTWYKETELHTFPVEGQAFGFVWWKRVWCREFRCGNLSESLLYMFESFPDVSMPRDTWNTHLAVGWDLTDTSTWLGHGWNSMGKLPTSNHQCTWSVAGFIYHTFGVGLLLWMSQKLHRPCCGSCPAKARNIHVWSIAAIAHNKVILPLVSKQFTGPVLGNL